MSENQFGTGAAGDAGNPSDATHYILELEEVDEGNVESAYLPGQEFAEHRLVRLVASEAMAELWEAYDSQLDCTRAIKIMRPEVAKHAQTVEQFFQQARSQARLQHPNILQVQRVGRYGPNGIPFFVSEWVDGESLEQRLQREGALSPAAAWDILRQIISGLAYAHEQGMIHRDLHPGNILLENPIRDSGDRRVRVRIKDFGLAAILDAPFREHAIVPGSKPEYTAPEIVAGMEVDHRADIYSLGIVLYHMLAGFPPFQGSKRGEILFKQVHDPLPAVSPQVREALGSEGMAILTRMTQKRPDLRYARYDELLEATRTSPVMQERRRTEPVAVAQAAASPAQAAATRVAGQGAAGVAGRSGSGRKSFPLVAAGALVLVLGAVWLVPKFLGRGSVGDPEPIRAESPASGGREGAGPEASQAAGASPESPGADDPASAVQAAAGVGEAAATAEGSAGDSSGLKPPPPLGAVAEAGANGEGADPDAAAEQARPAATPAGFRPWSELVHENLPAAPGEIIIDNATPGALRLTPTAPGTWRNSSQPGAYNYSSLLATADGTEKTATFLADIPEAGEYEVFISWISGGPATRSDSVVVTIHTADGPFKGIIDQTGPANTGDFYPVGSYEFPSGESLPVVTISTEKIEPGPERMVSVDAVKLVRKGSGGSSGFGGALASGETAPRRLPAGAIVVESGKGGKNHEQYKEVAGRWLDSKTPAVAAKSSATGLSSAEECPGRKFVFSAVGEDKPAVQAAEARFYPELALPGRFHVYVTWPHGGNVTPVHYVVQHAGGTTTRTLTQDGYGPGPGSPNNANVWIRLGEFEFEAGRNQYVALVVQPGARAVHTTANGQAYADAVCFSPEPIPDAQDDDQVSTRSIMMIKTPPPPLATVHVTNP